MSVSRETKTCPAPGCAAPIRPSQLMCRRHWATVPKPLREAVWFWFRKWQAWRSGRSAAEIVPIVEELRKGQRAAIDAAAR